MTEGKRIATLLLALLAAIILLWRCAHQGSLSGGPKDVVAPIFIESEPPQRTLYFEAKKITLTFNEFLQLKDPAKEIFISPPMQLKPEYKVHGKEIVVEFKEPLKENSTYTINFGNAIADFTEGNVSGNFEYVFSTGNAIDSLSIAGKVVNAFDLKPEAGIIAMVYTDDNDTLPLDSLPLNVPPRSASKTDKEGNYRINNLSAGAYLLFALEDLNNNFFFDMPNERIGFLDSLVVLSAPVLLPVDTGFLEAADSSETIIPEAVIPAIPIHLLHLFKQIDSTQKLLSKKLIGDNRLQYIFRMPADSFAIDLVDFIPDTNDWYIPEYNKTLDTIDIWLKPGLPDTIRVKVSDGYSLVDTTRFLLSSLLRNVRQKKLDGDYIQFFANTRAGALDLNKSLSLSFPDPLVIADSSRITLKSDLDSISPSLIFTDTVRRKLTFDHRWVEGMIYKIIINDSAFTDLSGRVNDSTTIGFKVRRTEDYGILALKVVTPAVNEQYIIQLLDPKEKVLQEKIIGSTSVVRFDFLLPGKYKIKAIHDVNRNLKWDPGKYATHLLPERVSYYPGELEIRANWDLQEEWKLAEE